MKYEFKKREEIHILHLKGDLLGEAQTNKLADDINHKLEEGENQFIVDLSKLRFINSSGLSFLLKFLTRSRKAGGDVILANIPEQLSKLLIITKLNNVFVICDNMDEAFSSLEKV